jgi:hypothetical protein
MQGRLVKCLKPAFEDSIRAACDSRRTSRELRQALEFLDRSENPKNLSASGDDADLNSFLAQTGSQLICAGGGPNSAACTVTATVLE